MNPFVNTLNGFFRKIVTVQRRRGRRCVSFRSAASSGSVAILRSFGFHNGKYRSWSIRAKIDTGTVARTRSLYH